MLLKHSEIGKALPEKEHVCFGDEKDSFSLYSCSCEKEKSVYRGGRFFYLFMTAKKNAERCSTMLSMLRADSFRHLLRDRFNHIKNMGGVRFRPTP